MALQRYITEKTVEHIRLILEHPEVKKYQNTLFKNHCITWPIVSAMDLSWDYYWLSRNPNITWDIVKSHPDKPWDYSQISANFNITCDIIQSNPDKPWDYSCLSSTVTWDDVSKSRDKPWNYLLLSKNPSITLGHR